MNIELTADITALSILLGFVLDLLLGDPHWMYHPVRLIGALISFLEKELRARFPKTPRGEVAAGGVMALLVCGAAGITVSALTLLSSLLGFWCELVCRTILCYWLFALRSLRDESAKVQKKLAQGDLPGARAAVSMIVGRDTERLSFEGVAKAAVETIAENTSDGIIAPMFFMVIGGPAAGWIYKAVNTMDSMVGYKNEKYQYFGRIPARLDDILNFIPARISALMMILTCFLIGMDGREAFRIFRRDRYNHASPNSAQTESVMAGALGVQLAGDAFYFGKRVSKKTIGDNHRMVDDGDILLAHRLLYAVSVLTLVLFLALRLLVRGGF